VSETERAHLREGRESKREREREREGKREREREREREQGERGELSACHPPLPIGSYPKTI